MNAPTRLAFLGLAQKAIAAAAVGAMGIRFIEAAEAEIKKGDELYRLERGPSRPISSTCFIHLRLQ